MNKCISTFSNGMNQDINVNKYPNTCYFSAENFRLLNREPLSSSALTNVKGTLPKISLSSGHTINGYCLIRNTLVLFVDSDEGGKIYIWEYEDSDYESNPSLIYYDPDLDFSNEIIAVGHYENENVQKVYFTDKTSFFRQLNIVHPTLGIGNQLTYDLNSLDLVPDVSFSNISLEIESGGNLTSGKIQYSYQLYSVRGSETVFSPTSELLDITEANNNNDSYYYYGSDTNITINKSVKVTITNPDTVFTRLRLVALEYTVFNRIPKIRIVGEYNIEGLTSISITDNGSSIGYLTLEEFRFLQNDFYPQTIEIKNNYLFAANIKDNYFDISDEDWDVRAFRANSLDEIVVYDANSPVNVPYPFDPLTLPPQTSESFNSFNDTSNDYNSNNVGLDSTQQLSEYKYIPGTSGATLGGKGLNVEYEFVTTKVLLDDSNKTIDYGEGYPRLSVGASNTEDNIITTNLVGYQRDEIYRFGIIPIDNKGREGFVKWIGDIRFPNNREIPYVEYDTVNGKTYAYILGIKFTVNIPTEIEDFISGYRIVRADRTSSDKTIMAQGLVSYPINSTDTNAHSGGDYSNYLYSLSTCPTVKDMVYKYTATERNTQDLSNISGADYFEQNNPEVILNSNWIEFDSPDIVLSKNKLSSSDAYIDVFGYQNQVETFGISGERGYEDNDKGDEETRDILVADKTRNFDFESNTYRIKSNISNYRLLQPKPRGSEAGPTNDATNIIIEGGQIYNNQSFSPIDHATIKEKWGLRGTHSLLTIESELPLTSDWHDSSEELRFLIGNYKINRGRSIYGGSTYEARTNTKYYPASEFIPKETTEVYVYNGDTYISYFVYMRSIYDKERSDGYRIESYMFYPIESTINFNLRTDRIQEYINWGLYRDKNVTNYKLTESVSSGVLNYGLYYPTDIGDLYRYNFVYSSIDKSKEYYPRPIDFQNITSYDTRIISSSKKINGEYIDSWTKFKYNENIDVDSSKGSIYRLLTFKNNLLYFQEKGVGIVSVEQRSIIQDNNVAGLVLGTGGILTRFDYITEQSGINNYNAVTSSNNTVYYVDSINKRINKIEGDREISISLIKGMDSFFSTLDFDTIVTGFDRGFNEILFTIDNYTIVFSELIDAFISFYTFIPKLMFSINKDFFSVGENGITEDTLLVNDIEDLGYIGDTEADVDWDTILISDGGSSDSIFKHNCGLRGVFYGNEDTVQDSSITLIINPNANIVNSYDNLDMRTESTSSGTDNPTDTFYSMDISNSYQSTSRTLSFTMNNTAPNGVTYNDGTIKRIARIWRTPLMQVQTAGANFKRFVDTYVKIKLYYNNDNNYLFKLHDIITYYRETNR